MRSVRESDELYSPHQEPRLSSCWINAFPSELECYPNPNVPEAPGTAFARALCVHYLAVLVMSLETPPQVRFEHGVQVWAGD